MNATLSENFGRIEMKIIVIKILILIYNFTIENQASNLNRT